MVNGGSMFNSNLAAPPPPFSGAGQLLEKNPHVR